MGKKSYIRTAEQDARYKAFTNLVSELNVEIKNNTLSDEKKQLADKAQKLEGLTRLSLKNQILVLMQRPGAQVVYGFHDWKKRGFIVQKGSVPIHIIAPRTQKNDEGERVVKGFSSRLVYDQDQVSPSDPRPEEQAYVHSLGEDEDFE